MKRLQTTLTYPKVCVSSHLSHRALTKPHTHVEALAPLLPQQQRASPPAQVMWTLNSALARRGLLIHHWAFEEIQMLFCFHIELRLMIDSRLGQLQWGSVLLQERVWGLCGRGLGEVGRFQVKQEGGKRSEMWEEFEMHQLYLWEKSDRVST